MTWVAPDYSMVTQRVRAEEFDAVWPVVVARAEGWSRAGGYLAISTVAREP